MRNNQRKRALVVENDERLLTSFCSLLQNAGFETETTWSGQEALRELEKRRFDVLLVDDYLADQHLTDFLKRVGQLPNQPSVVVMQSSSPRPSVVRRLRRLGVSSVVNKRDTDAVQRSVMAEADEQLIANM